MKKESPLRSMMAEAHNQKYIATDTLDEAKNLIDYFLVMEGDDGGQIYLSCPAKLVECDEETLAKILLIIDENQWSNFDASMRTIFYEQLQPNKIVPGGMGGGLTLENDLWVHEEIKKTKPLLKEIIMNKNMSKDINSLLKNLKEILPPKN